jgi:hypothetical protein
MKTVIALSVLALYASGSYAQSEDYNQRTSSSAKSNSSAIGGGQGVANSAGGAGGAGGNSLSSVQINLAEPSAAPTAAAANTSGSLPTQKIEQRVTSVGNAGSSSYGVSFSQYNCASTAGAGVGFMGGAFQFGVGKESDPCNARANASAIFAIAQTLAATNPTLAAQLFHAAILLIGNSTKDTQTALTTAGVNDWSTVTNAMPGPIVPPAAAPAAPAAPATPAAPPPAIQPKGPISSSSAVAVVDAEDSHDWKRIVTAPIEPAPEPVVHYASEQISEPIPAGPLSSALPMTFANK